MERVPWISCDTCMLSWGADGGPAVAPAYQRLLWCMVCQSGSNEFAPCWVSGDKNSWLVMSAVVGTENVKGLGACFLLGSGHE